MNPSRKYFISTSLKALKNYIIDERREGRERRDEGVIEKSAKIILQILAGVDVSFTVHFMIHKRRLLIAAACDVRRKIKFLKGTFSIKAFLSSPDDCYDTFFHHLSLPHTQTRP